MTSLLRRALFLGALASLALLALPAVAQETYPIVFPVDGPHAANYDTFGDCRAGCTRSHEGADIMADKLVPVVAAGDGFVTVVRGFEPDGTPTPHGSQWLVVQHDGWQTRYLHLNNDTEGTDDGLGYGVVPEILDAWVAYGGTEAYPNTFAFPVTAGQQIGWVGDSGNAEGSGPHLHFELRLGEGWDSVAIDAYLSLLAADPAVTGKGWNGTFSDDDDSVHEGDIETLAAQGITKGCNPPANTNYCPQRLMTRGEIAAFIRRTLDLPVSDVDAFADDAGNVFEGDINAVTAAGIGFGCTDTDYCPDEPILRDEMAEMLVRTFAAADPERYANPDGIDFFTDDEESEWEDSINLLMAAGVTKGCNPPDNDNYCPDRPLIRAELASFFVRALGA